MQLQLREYFRADCGGGGGAVREHEEDTTQENAIINEFIAAPDALSVFARILSELAEASSSDAGEGSKQLEQQQKVANRTA